MNPYELAKELRREAYAVVHVHGRDSVESNNAARMHSAADMIERLASVLLDLVLRGDKK